MISRRFIYAPASLPRPQSIDPTHQLWPRVYPFPSLTRRASLSLTQNVGRDQPVVQHHVRPPHQLHRPHLQGGELGEAGSWSCTSLFVFPVVAPRTHRD